jgi:ABC-type nitrate/sulfonate/bicarbonate transport system substrate-binding protein
MGAKKGFWAIRRVRLGAALVLTAGMLAAGILSSCAKRTGRVVNAEIDDQGKEVYKIKTWSRLDCSGTPYIVGVKRGFFERHGIEIVFTGEIQGSQRIPSVAAGDNDVGEAHPNTIAIAREGGAKIRGVVLGDAEPDETISDIHLQHMWWVSDKSGPLQKLEDIKTLGRPVKMQLIQRNTCTEFLTDIWLDRYGIPKDKIEFISMPDIEGVLALKQGIIDISTPHPTFYKAIEDTGIGNILITSRPLAGKDSAATLVYFTDDFIANNPEPIRHFVMAFKEAQRWTNDNPAEAAALTQDWIGVPVQASHFYSRTGTIDEAGIQLWIDGSKKSGALPADTALSFRDIITHEFDFEGDE